LNGVSAHDIVQRHDCVERFPIGNTVHATPGPHSSPDGFSQPLFYPDSWSHAPRPVNPSEVLSMVTTLLYIQVKQRVTETVNEDNPLLLLSSHLIRKALRRCFNGSIL
jgi:hypothetical protein